MEKRVILKNKQGKRIVGLWSLPVRGTPPFPAVVVCHGFKGRKEGIHLLSLARSLAKQGIAAFRFDFTNEVGESDGNIEQISFTQKLRDLAAVVDYVARQKFVDSKRIGLTGHSQGGQAVLHYAPTDYRIKTVVSLAGPTYRGGGNTDLMRRAKDQLREAKKTGFFSLYSKRTHKKYHLPLSFYYDILSHNTPAQIKKINVPALFVHGLADKSVPLVHARKGYALVRGPKRLVTFPGVPHTWRQAKHYSKINKVVTTWFETYL